MRKKPPPVRHEIKPRYHPSGRPLRDEGYRGLGFHRPIREEPLVLGLRPGRDRAYAVGFMAQLTAPDDD